MIEITDQATLEEIMAVRKDAFKEHPYYISDHPDAMNQELLDGSDLLVAREDGEIVGYLVFQKPGDGCYAEQMLNISTKIIEGLRSLQRQQTDVKLTGLIPKGTDNDVHLYEMAVLDGKQNSGVGSMLMEAVLQKVEGNVFSATRRGWAMESLFDRYDFEEILEYGPVFTVGKMPQIMYVREA